MRIFSYFFVSSTIKTYVYMLQLEEYDSWRFLRWVVRFPNLSRLRSRGNLDFTSRARLLVLVAYIIWIVLAASVLSLAYFVHISWVLLLLGIPFFVATLIAIFNVILQTVVITPQEQRTIAAAHSILSSHKALRIAVMGSYGKTTVKELLKTVLSEDKKVAATPGNKNVVISHARWIQQLDGDEDVLIFEYGEAQPGDIKNLAKLSKPDWAIITGIAPAHMDGYGSLDAIADDFQSIGEFVDMADVYINADSGELTKRIHADRQYSSKGCGDWKIKNTNVSPEGMSLIATKNQTSIDLDTRLIGEHLLGPLILCVAIADRLGFSTDMVQASVTKTIPFDHRMQPYRLNDAWIIDDTYNGNLEGMRAGLRLLEQLDGSRKIYVTPGLVEQGDLAKKVHIELGELIAAANPNMVVLMQNSVTSYIKKGLVRAGYQGEVRTELKPLNFYQNIAHFVAAGDVVLMQNDWPDNYQ
jgi:UDP-N-acetylmuramoyl-tripeptide--D-alanyl-D-alanine ligase